MLQWWTCLHTLSRHPVTVAIIHITNTVWQYWQVGFLHLLPGHVCVSWKIPHSCDMSDVILDNSSNLINIYTVKAVLKPYYGWCWNCSSLVLYISDSNQGVFNIIISQYYSKITNLTIRKTLITRKDVTRKEKVDICWVYSTWAENKLSTAYRNEAVELQIRGSN